MFSLRITCQRTPTISDLFLFSPDVQPPGNYSFYNIVQKHFTIYLSLNKMSEKTSAVSTLTIHFIAISSFRMFNLHVTCQRTPTISDLFLFSPHVQPPGNYSLYNIVQKHFTIYLSLNKTSEKTSAVSTLTIHFIAISCFHIFNLCVTCQRTPTISDLFLFSMHVQPPDNYSLYNIVQKHFTIYLSLNKMSEKTSAVSTLTIYFIVIS